MTLDGGALKRLAAVQQSQGHVTLADIGNVIPVDSMTPEEIAEAMAQVEAAGIDIEVDKEFLRHRPDAGLAVAPPPASHSRFGAPDARGSMTGHSDQGSLLPRAAARPPSRLSVGGSWRRPRARANIVIILVLAVLCLLILVFVKR